MIRFKRPVLLLFFASAIFIRCEKRVFDYRNKYTGHFRFEYRYHSWTINNGSQGSDSGAVNGKIFYKRSDEKNVIYISMEKDMPFEIDKNGKL